jgi:hypothetical protein
MPYRTESFRRAALEPLRCAGVESDDIDFRLCCENGTVTGHAVFRAAASLDGQAIPANHTVRCFSSRRFDPQQALDLLDPALWRILHSSVSSAGDHMLVAASPRGEVGR